MLMLISLPVRKTGIETKNPVMAHVRVMDASFRYLMVLKNKFRNVKTVTACFIKSNVIFFHTSQSLHAMKWTTMENYQLCLNIQQSTNSRVETEIE